MSYSVNNDQLLVLNGSTIEFVPSINTSGEIRPRFLVIHYTAGSLDARGTAQYFQKPSAKTSAHLCMDLDGSVIQSVPFTTKAWHAGRSTWAGYTGLNSHSIGIEVCNPGPLTKTTGGQYKTWWGQTIDHPDIIEAPHQNNPSGPVYGWLPFTYQQVESLIDIGQVLMEEYDLHECIGHDMISPGRKTDPGPCMDVRVYDRINNSRNEENELQWQVAEVSSLNGRAGPGTHYQILHTLSPGDDVEVLMRNGLWWQVEVDNGIQVWVHSKFLSPS